VLLPYCAEWKTIMYGLCARPSSGLNRTTMTLYKPKPRYAKPEVTLPPTSSTSTTLNFESTDQIREAAFKEWLAKRSTQFKRRASEITLKQKESEEQKAKVLLRNLLFFNF